MQKLKNAIAAICLIIPILLSGCDTWPLRHEGRLKSNSNLEAVIKRAEASAWQKIPCSNIQPGETEAHERYGKLLEKSSQGNLACIQKKFAIEEKQNSFGLDQANVRAIIFQKSDSQLIEYEVWAEKGLPAGMKSVAVANKELRSFSGDKSVAY